MSDEKVVHFPNQPLGMRAQAGTLDSDADPTNPFLDSLRGLIRERRALIDRYGSSDGSVWEIERKIAERVIAIAGEGQP